MRYRALAAREAIEQRDQQKRQIYPGPWVHQESHDTQSDTATWDGFLTGAWVSPPTTSADSSASSLASAASSIITQPPLLSTSEVSIFDIYTTTNVYGVVTTVTFPVDTPEPTDEVLVTVQFVRDKFTPGAQAGIIISCILGFAAIVVASIWFCCGKPRRKRLRATEEMQLHRERQEAAARAEQRPLGSSVENISVPAPAMTELNTSGVSQGSIAPPAARGAVGRSESIAQRHMSLRGGGSDAPPTYEECVPATHKRLAGGTVQRGGPIQFAPSMEDEDGSGMVADGKMPISEMALEDVVVDRRRDDVGEGPARDLLEGGRDFGMRHGSGGGDTTGHSNV